MVNSEKRDDEPFSMFDLFDDGKYLWFSAIEHNALFRIDKETSEMEYIGRFPGEEPLWRLYATVTEYDGKLYFTPCSACEIAVYDTKAKRFEKINIGISQQENDVSKIKYAKKFISAFIQGNRLILIPCCYDKTVIYKIDSKQVFQSTELYSYFHKKYRSGITSPDRQFYLCWIARRTGEKEIVFDLHSNRNIVIFYDLETGCFREQAVGMAENSYTMTAYDGRYIWLYEVKTDTVVRWEKGKEEYRAVCIAEKIPAFSPCGLKNSFTNFAVCGEWLYLLPAFANMTVKIHTETMDVQIAENLFTEWDAKEKNVAYSSLCRVSGDKLYFFGNMSRTIFELSQVGGVREIPVRLSERCLNGMEQDDIAEIIQRRKGDLFIEGNCSLTNFLKAVSSVDFEMVKLLQSDTTGKDIYDITAGKTK